MTIIITSCSASKDDVIPIQSNTRTVNPSYYLNNQILASKLLSIRDLIFADPRAKFGVRSTYAFDLYVQAGRAYNRLFKRNYVRTKQYLQTTHAAEWFFLSGGYGIIHALEAAFQYQASFNYHIARQNNIPYTTKYWKDVLPDLCEAIFRRFSAHRIYVFGSRDYTNFIKNTRSWKESNNIQIFESTGSSGPYWIAPILDELVVSILEHKLSAFMIKYQDKFVKQ
jgi:cytoplasmic iron level regulating protein YaaA (DUF328/UPF0246 family)